MRETVDEIRSGHITHQEIIKEHCYSKGFACWVPQMLTGELRQKRREVADKGWSVFPNPAVYSPQLAFSKLHLFDPYNSYLRGQKCDDDESVRMAVKARVREC